MKTSSNWAVALSADNSIDLKIAEALFKIGEPSIGEITVQGERTETAMFSEEFEGMTEAADVRNASIPIIDAINGICFIQEPARSPLRPSGVHRRLPPDGWDGGIVFASAVASGSARATAFAQSLDKDGNVKTPTQSRQSVWLQNALKDDAALDVLAYIRGTPDWFELYKVYEAMRVDGGAAAAWPDTGHFTRSANINRHFSGHSSAKQTPGKPFVPMKLEEATSFIRSLATMWLNSKFPDSTTSAPSE